jgi:hypothetical protein
VITRRQPSFGPSRAKSISQHSTLPPARALRSLESNHCAIRKANSHRIRSLHKNTQGGGGRTPPIHERRPLMPQRKPRTLTAKLEVDDKSSARGRVRLQKVTTIQYRSIGRDIPRFSVEKRQPMRRRSLCRFASWRRDGWPCGCVDRCRSGRCCRSWRHRCRRRSGWIFSQAARPRT